MLQEGIQIDKQAQSLFGRENQERLVLEVAMEQVAATVSLDQTGLELCSQA